MSARDVVLGERRGYCAVVGAIFAEHADAEIACALGTPSAGRLVIADADFAYARDAADEERQLRLERARRRVARHRRARVARTALEVLATLAISALLIGAVLFA